VIGALAKPTVRTATSVTMVVCAASDPDPTQPSESPLARMYLGCCFVREAAATPESA
jgi:hypothetical protein